MGQPVFRHPSMYPGVCDSVSHPNLASRQRHLCPQLPRAPAPMVQWLRGLIGHRPQLKADALSEPTPLLGVAGGGVGRKTSLLASVCSNSEGPPSSELLTGSAADSIAIASPFNFAFFPALLSSFPYKLQPPTCKPNFRHTLRVYSMSVCFLQQNRGMEEGGAHMCSSPVSSASSTEQHSGSSLVQVLSEPGGASAQLRGVASRWRWFWAESSASLVVPT